MRRVLRSVLSTLLLVGAATASCTSPRVTDGFARVEPGMTKEEVVAVLGPPSSTWPLSRTLDGVDGTRLQWGDGLSSLASSVAFRGDPDRAWSVSFDETGRVVSKAPPRWVEEAAAEEDVLRERRLERASDAGGTPSG